MHRLYSIALPALLGTTALDALPVSALAPDAVPVGALAPDALPTIPLLRAAPPANGIVAAADGTLYFVDDHGTVWRTDPDAGVRTFIAGRSGGSLGIDDAGNVYGTQLRGRDHSVLWRADPDGVITQLASAPAGAAFSLGSVATQTRDGRLIVATDRSVRRVALDGTVTVLAADVALLEPRSNLLSRLFGTARPHLTGIAETDNGDIYIANAARGVIVCIRFGGHVEELAPAEPGWVPAGVAAANGAVYVLEHGNGVRVRRIERDGSSSVVASVAGGRSSRAVAGGGWLGILPG
jgi:hypothetical protein